MKVATAKDIIEEIDLALQNIESRRVSQTDGRVRINLSVDDLHELSMFLKASEVGS